MTQKEWIQPSPVLHHVWYSQQHNLSGSQVTKLRWQHLPLAWGVQQVLSCRARGISAGIREAFPLGQHIKTLP